MTNPTSNNPYPAGQQQLLPEGVAVYEVAGDSMDRLCSIEMRPRGMPRGFLVRLYEAARAFYGPPLGLLAAWRLKESLADGRRPVLIGTAAGRPVVEPKGETDGPIGSALLARALHVALGAVPVFVCGEEFAGPVQAAAEAAGFTFATLAESLQRNHGATLITVPTRVDQKEQQRARAILEEVHPAAVIAVERPGPNIHGITHSTRGTASPTPTATIAALMLEARSTGLLTVGIGDAGNEVGFGALAEAVREIHPYGRRCQCPCEGGVACAVPADVVVVAACSNLGAYNVADCLSLLTRNPEAMVTPQLEARVFDACVRAGAEEAGHGRALWCDGIPMEAHSAFVRLLQEVVSVEGRVNYRPW